MKNLFINFTNHPFKEWEEKQLNEAKEYGEIVDIKFPEIDPKLSISEIRKKAENYVKQIVKMDADSKVVHIMGEMTFTNYVVNKLLQLDIQCVASTTVRDTAIGEDGTKISKFHFEQFRPYSNPIVTKNDNKVVSKWVKRDYFSFAVLILVLIGEFAYFMNVHNLKNYYSIRLFIGAFALIAIIWLIGLSLKEIFVPRSIIMHKLLANTIAPRGLGVLYLFLFVVHIGWLTNAIMNLFVPLDNYFEVAKPLGVCLLGMLSLIAFFPDGRKKKVEKASKVFVSGISSISYSYNGEVKPNLIPLVRILQKTKLDENDCEMLILHSDLYSKEENKEKIDKNIELYKKHILKKLFAEDQISFNEDFDNAKEYNDKLRSIIKYMAMVEFPEKKWIKNHLTITFTEEANYDDFNNCFKILSKPIKDRDDANHELYFNLTPGTNSAAALMTLMAIDGSRKLFFYKQNVNENEVPKSDRLVEVEKSDIPLSSLLSQALDSIM